MRSLIPNDAERLHFPRLIILKEGERPDEHTGDPNAMKTISFHELYTLDFELSDLFGQKQKWIKGVLFRMDHPRHSSAVIYLNGCHGKYINKRGGAD